MPSKPATTSTTPMTVMAFLDLMREADSKLTHAQAIIHDIRSGIIDASFGSDQLRTRLTALKMALAEVGIIDVGV